MKYQNLFFGKIRNNENQLVICSVCLENGNGYSLHHQSQLQQRAFLFFFYFSEKIRLGFSCESSAYLMVHMKCQPLFEKVIIIIIKKEAENAYKMSSHSFSENQLKYFKMLFAAVVIVILRVKLSTESYQ